MDPKALDEPLAIKMTRGSILNLHFIPIASSLEEARPSPVSAHSILKNPPPREKEKAWKGGTGREGGAPSPRGAGRIVRVTTQSERTHWSKATTHTERAISQSFVGKRFAQRI